MNSELQLELFPKPEPNWDEVEQALVFYMQKASQLESQLKEIKDEIETLKFSMSAANMDCDKILALAGSGVEESLAGKIWNDD